MSAVQVLALIPARGGSKGVPGKNVRPLGGRGLIRYAVEAARESGVVDRIVLTTDAVDIAEAGRAAGAEVPFVRPPHLAGDDAPMLPVVEHAVAQVEAAGWHPGIVLLLQPTSPLRRGQHLADAVRTLQETGADSVVSVVALPLHLSPDYVMRIDGGRLTNFLDHGARVMRRQDARPAYVRDGTVYCFRRETLTRHGNLYGADCRPLLIAAEESLTIDTPDDWSEAERRLALRAGQ
ncbi:MAG TPA: acylneuraminate cytidylyltransferase family protein [Vicinamibacterales bacterium]|nr:acylneuraminate cytidylyltransferase family protein [Vicinamibacterales bacterium]